MALKFVAVEQETSIQHALITLALPLWQKETLLTIVVAMEICITTIRRRFAYFSRWDSGQMAAVH
jgi:hypothetical protein